MKSLIVGGGASLLLAGTALAGTDAKAAPEPDAEAGGINFANGILTIDLGERVRVEARNNNRDFNDRINDNDDAWVLNRFRLGMAVRPAPWVKIYAQMQDTREWDSDRPNVPGVRGTEGGDEFDLRQAYLELGNLKDFPLALTVGRQPLSYGDRRLLADSVWANFGRTFDAAKLRWQPAKGWTFDLFAGRQVQIKEYVINDSDVADNLLGFYLTAAALAVQTTDFYVLHRDKSDDQPDLDPVNKLDPRGAGSGPAQRTTTIGTRWKSTPGALGNWDYTAEFAYQLGDVWTGNRNPADGSSQSFQNLYASNHEKYGFMDEFAWRNLHDARLSLSAKPAKSVEVTLDYHAFWLADTSDYWYRANGISPLRVKTPAGRDVRTVGAGNFAGQEIDFTVTWKATAHLTFLAGYSHFFAGDYLRDTGPHAGANFAYVQATLSF